MLGLVVSVGHHLVQVELGLVDVEVRRQKRATRCCDLYGIAVSDEVCVCVCVCVCGEGPWDAKGREKAKEEQGNKTEKINK